MKQNNLTDRFDKATTISGTQKLHSFVPMNEAK